MFGLRFETVIRWMLFMYNFDNTGGLQEISKEVIVEKKDTEVWLYVLLTHSNYSQKNVMKIGFSTNVEANICSHLSNDAKINYQCSFKTLMLRSDAIAFKDKIRKMVEQHSIKTRRTFKGKSDWFYSPAFDIVMEELPKGTVYQDIDWKKYQVEYHKRKLFIDRAIENRLFKRR